MHCVRKQTPSRFHPSRCQKNSLIHTIANLNEVDKCKMHVAEKSLLLNNHKNINQTNLDKLSADDLKRINVKLDYIHWFYVRPKKVGYLNDEERRSWFPQKREMTAEERIDARKKFSDLIKDYPEQSPYFLSMMLELRLL